MAVIIPYAYVVHTAPRLVIDAKVRTRVIWASGRYLIAFLLAWLPLFFDFMSLDTVQTPEPARWVCWSGTFNSAVFFFNLRASRHAPLRNHPTAVISGLAQYTTRWTIPRFSSGDLSLYAAPNDE